MARKNLPTPVSEVDDPVLIALKEGHREFLRFVARRTSNMADAEDILQDFYLKVVQSARTIRVPGSLRGWLAQVLRRTLADYYRRASVRRKGHARLKAAEASSLVVNDAAEQAVCACLYRILPTLPSDYAQMVWRVDLLGEPRDRVAKALRITPNNLAVKVHRARRALRTALERFCTTCPTHGFLNCSCEEGRKLRAEEKWFEREATVMQGESARLSRKIGPTESPRRGPKQLVAAQKRR